MHLVLVSAQAAVSLAPRVFLIPQYMTREEISRIVDRMTAEDFRTLRYEWSTRNKANSGASSARCNMYVRRFKAAWQEIYNEKYRFHIGQFDKQCVRDWFVQYLRKMEFTQSTIARTMGATLKEIETVDARVNEQKILPVVYQLPSIYIRKFQKYLDEHGNTN